MVLNQDKFQLVIHSVLSDNAALTMLKQLPFYSSLVEYEISPSCLLSSSEFVKDLGILICSDLSWDVHISKLTNKAKRISGWILNVFKTRNKKYKVQVGQYRYFCG